MAARRIIIDPSDPAAMTPKQRRAELAAIFAAGVIRLFEQRHFAVVGGSEAHPTRRNPADSGQSRLEVPPAPRPYGPRG